MRSIIALLLCLAACSSSTGGYSNGRTSLVFPPGVAPFKNTTAAVAAGIYPGSGTNCCFLSQSARLELDKPTGALHAKFNFYVPKVPTYDAGLTGTVSAAGENVGGSMNGSPGRRIVVTLDLPPSYANQTSVPVAITASKSLVPSNLGMSGDRRNLSFLLLKVEYI